MNRVIISQINKFIQSYILVTTAIVEQLTVHMFNNVQVHNNYVFVLWLLQLPMICLRMTPMIGRLTLWQWYQIKNNQSEVTHTRTSLLHVTCRIHMFYVQSVLGKILSWRYYSILNIQATIISCIWKVVSLNVSFNFQDTFKNNLYIWKILYEDTFCHILLRIE